MSDRYIIRTTGQAGPTGPAGAEGGTSALTADGQILTRSGGSPTGITRASLAADTAFATPYGSDGASAAVRPLLDTLKMNLDVDQSILVLGDSTGNATDEWVYLFAVALAARYPAWTVLYRLWDDGTKVYGSATTIQTGSGSRTLTIYNASISGWELDHVGARQAAAADAYQPNLIMLSIGHNEYEGSAVVIPVTQGASVSYANPEFRNRYLLCCERLRHGNPLAPLICIAQNPRTDNNKQAVRAAEIERICAARGYGFLNVHQAFIDTGDVATYVQGDAVHPNAAGSALWRDTVLNVFQTERAGRGPIPAPPPSSLAMKADNLLTNPLFATYSGSDFTGWTRSNVTATQDTTNYETGTQAAKLVTTGTAASIYQDLPLPLVKGQWVTVAARIRRNGADTNLNGRVALVETGGGAVTVYGTTFPDYGTDFHWCVRTMFCQPTATRLRCHVYSNTSATGTGDITVDRVIAVRGVLPMDQLA